MKNILLMVMLMLMGFGVMAQEYHKAKFKVWGNCEMCQTKIVKAAKSVEGVKKAHWNIATLQMSVKFDTDLTSLENIQKVSFNPACAKLDQQSAFSHVHHVPKAPSEGNS